MLFQSLVWLVSCGGPKGPAQVAEAMLRAAQERDYDEMLSYMSPEVQREMNMAALAGMEIVSFSIDEVEYSFDSTMVDLEYTITVKRLHDGETDVEEDEFELMKDAEGRWVIVDM